MNERDTNKENWILAALLLLALGLRVWGASWGLPYEYQTEEYKVIKYALRMGQYGLNPHFFEYPSLYLYFMLFVYGLYYLIGRAAGLFSGTRDFALLLVRDPTSFHLIGRILEALFGVGVVFLAYRAGRAAFSRRTGLLAAFVTAVLPSAIFTGHVTKGDMAAVFLGMVFWLCAYRIYEEGKTRDYVLAGTLLGLAVSTKYYLAPLGIALPAAHFLSKRRGSHAMLAISLALIPLFFLIGTPYAWLSRGEFLQFFRDQRNAFASFTGPSRPYADRFLDATRRLIRMEDDIPRFWIGAAGLGALCLAGALASVAEKKSWLFLAPIFAYWIIVSGYHNPAAGYLAPVFPLIAVLGAEAAVRFSRRLRRGALAAWIAVCAAAALSALANAIVIDRSYVLPDTRTEAKSWIEANIPPGSPILMDLASNNPPLEMDRGQLARLLEIAERTDNYKKEYFRLKLDSLRPGTTGYEILFVKRSAEEVGSLPYQVRQAQQVQDLFDPRNGSPVSRLRKAGVRYVIVSSWSKDNAAYYPDLAGFYREIEGKGRLLREFAPTRRDQPGPAIRIYEIPG